MADLTKDEMRVLDAVDMFCSQPYDIRADMRDTYNDLIRRGYIAAHHEYRLTDKARQIINERDSSCQ